MLKKEPTSLHIQKMKLSLITINRNNAAILQRIAVMYAFIS